MNKRGQEQIIQVDSSTGKKLFIGLIILMVISGIFFAVWKFWPDNLDNIAINETDCKNGVCNEQVKLDMIIILSPQYSSEPRILEAVENYMSAVKADINWDSKIIRLSQENNSVGKIRDIIKSYYKNNKVKAVLIIGEDTKMPETNEVLNIDLPTTILWEELDSEIGYQVYDLNETYFGYWQPRNPHKGEPPLRIYPNFTAQEIDNLLKIGEQNTFMIKVSDMWTTGDLDAVKPEVFVSLLFPLKDTPYEDKVNKILSSLNKFSSRHNSYSNETYAYVHPDVAGDLSQAFQNLGNYHLIENCNPCNLNLSQSYKSLILSGHASPEEVSFSSSSSGSVSAENLVGLQTPFLIAQGCNIGGWYSQSNPNGYADMPDNFNFIPSSTICNPGKECMVSPSNEKHPVLFMELVMYPNDLQIVMLGIDNNHPSANYDTLISSLNSGKTIAEAYLSGYRDLRHLFYGDPTFRYT